MYLPLFAGMPDWLIPVILVAAFGVIVIIVILLRKYAPMFKSDEQPPSPKEVAEEELNRILQPIEEEKKNEGEDEQ